MSVTTSRIISVTGMANNGMAKKRPNQPFTLHIVAANVSLE
ncbi:hypothetical protein SAMN05216266_1483 [Amycolatopsis marina]|uniref:Uncharacterized protein n=1 Tax=Amycolatopsis marina TaxID=490629 RepID=A0A1I1CWL0_9PSEU|nr:hypothetical protein SAMN05216266_1483 [Amycolatopsis marina]